MMLGKSELRTLISLLVRLMDLSSSGTLSLSVVMVMKGVLENRGIGLLEVLVNTRVMVVWTLDKAWALMVAMWRLGKYDGIRSTTLGEGGLA